MHDEQDDDRPTPEQLEAQRQAERRIAAEQDAALKAVRDACQAERKRVAHTPSDGHA